MNKVSETRDLPSNTSNVIIITIIIGRFSLLNAAKPLVVKANNWKIGKLSLEEQRKILDCLGGLSMNTRDRIISIEEIWLDLNVLNRQTTSFPCRKTCYLSLFKIRLLFLFLIFRKHKKFFFKKELLILKSVNFLLKFQSKQTNNKTKIKMFKQLHSTRKKIYECECQLMSIGTIRIFLISNFFLWTEKIEQRKMENVLENY